MLKVKVEKGGIEKALKKWKRKYKQAKIGEELRERKEYTKKSVERRKEVLKAKYVSKKHRNDD